MSIILRCPKCEKHYESADDALKKHELECPECGLKSHSADFCAMMFCPNCRGKLAVSLMVLKERRLVCPRCDKAFAPNVSIDLDDETVNTNSLFEEDEEDDSATFKAGDFFDKYEIIRLLGRGGMGEVYLAKHLFLNREVALKIMLSSMSSQNPVFAKRFVREAKIANRILSPNLIPVYDVGIESATQTLFLAMEYINGINISDMVKAKGVLDENTILHVAYRAATALKAMEAANVVHRDIKPSNIMIDITGEVKLADLGIAKSAGHEDGELTLTQESMVFGTPNYSSPEQCRSSHNVDCRSDIYSLGATMFHMAAGYPPFRGENPMDTMLKVINEPPPSISSLPHKFSPAFAELIKDMLQKDPADRPQNADELQNRISEIFNGESGMSVKLMYLSKSAGRKLRPISGLISDVPSKIYNSIPWGFFRKLTGIAVILLILFAVFFFGIRRSGYFFDKLSGLSEKMEPAERSDVKKVSAADTKAPARKKVIHFDRTLLYKNKKPASSAATTKAASVSPVSEAEPSAKENNENKSAEEITVNNAAVSQDFPDTIDGRFAECSRILENLLSKGEKLSTLEAQQVKFYQTLRQTLNRQKRNRENAVQHKLSNAYSASATAAVQRLYRKITSDAEAADIAENLKKFVEMVKNPQVDPNLELTDSFSVNSDSHILAVAMKSKIFTPQVRGELIKILTERFTNTECLTKISDYDNFLNAELLQYGIDPLNGLLLHAVKTHKIDFVRQLISIGADVNDADSDGNTVLHWAIMLGDSSVIRMLIAAGADVNAVNKSDLQTPLFRAEQFADDTVVSLLIQAGSSVDYKDIYGKKASDYRHRREFIAAVKNNNLDKISDCLAHYPELVNIYLPNGMTPLQYACVELNTSMVKILLESGADAQKNSKKYPEFPLQIVFKPFYSADSSFFNNKKSSALEIFKAFIEFGVDYNIPYAAGENITILHFMLANYNKIDRLGMGYLTAVLKKVDLASDAPALVAFLYSSFENYDASEEKKNTSQRIKILKLLVNSQTYLNTSDGGSAMAVAASSLAVTETEMEFMLKHKADINGTDKNGRTAIFRLCEKAAGCKDKKTLIEYGNRINLLSDLGAKADCSVNGKTIADMKLPSFISDIKLIKEFRRMFK